MLERLEAWSYPPDGRAPPPKQFSGGVDDEHCGGHLLSHSVTGRSLHTSNYYCIQFHGNHDDFPDNCIYRKL